MDGFEIARYPVTNRQFQAFLDARDGYRAARWWGGLERPDESVQPGWDEPNHSREILQPGWEEPNHPRETVSWFEAVAFCRWLSELLRHDVRLPTEWEWQQAASGGDSANVYPWGVTWDSARCNSDESCLNRTTPVGIYPHGASIHGVLDLAGNVWEWCLNKHAQPTTFGADKVDSSSEERAQRGGFWGHYPDSCRTSCRQSAMPLFRDDGVGFRVLRPRPPRPAVLSGAASDLRIKAGRFQAQRRPPPNVFRSKTVEAS